MSEAALRQQLDEAKARRRATAPCTEEWAALCQEIGRLSDAIRRARRDEVKRDR